MILASDLHSKDLGKEAWKIWALTGFEFVPNFFHKLDFSINWATKRNVGSEANSSLEGLLFSLRKLVTSN